VEKSRNCVISSSVRSTKTLRVRLVRAVAGNRRLRHSSLIKSSGPIFCRYTNPGIKKKSLGPPRSSDRSSSFFLHLLPFCLSSSFSSLAALLSPLASRLFVRLKERMGLLPCRAPAHTRGVFRTLGAERRELRVSSPSASRPGAEPARGTTASPLCTLQSLRL